MIYPSMMASFLLATSFVSLFASDIVSDVQPIVESQFPQLCKDVDFAFETLMVKICDNPEKEEHKNCLLQARQDLHALQQDYSTASTTSIKEYLVRLDNVMRTVGCTLGKKGCWQPLSVEHRFAGIVTETQEHLFLMFLTVADHVQQLKDSIENMDFSFIRSVGSTVYDLARTTRLDLVAERSWYYALLGLYLLWIMPDEQAEKIMHVKVIGQEKDTEGKIKDIKEYSGFISKVRDFIGAATTREKEVKKKTNMRKTGPVAELLSWSNGLFDIEKSGTVFGTFSVIGICGPLIKRDIEEVYTWVKSKIAPQEELKCPCNDNKVLSYQERMRVVSNWVKQLGLELSAEEQRIIVASTGQITRAALLNILNSAVSLAHQQGVTVNLQYIEEAIDAIHRTISYSGYTGIERSSYAYLTACSMVVSHELLPSRIIAKATLCNKGNVYYYDELAQPYSFGEFHKAACCAELSAIKSYEMTGFNPSYDQVTEAKTRAFEHAIRLSMGGRNADYVSPEIRYQYYDATWNFVDQMFEETENIIIKNIDKIHTLAQALVNRDCLSSDEIYAIIA